MTKLHQLLLKTPFQTYVCLLENHKLLIMISLTSVSNSLGVPVNGLPY